MWLPINGNWIGRHSGKSWKTYWTRLPAAKALIDRMIALDEEPTDLQKYNIALTIKDLQDNCLWDRRWDCLYVCRGYGEASTKLNWIKNAHNLTKQGTGVLTFAEGVGYHSNGTSTYLSTNYTPSTEAVNMGRYDGRAFVKVSGSYKSMADHGAILYATSTDNNSSQIRLGYEFNFRHNDLLSAKGPNGGTALPIIGYMGGAKIAVAGKEYKATNEYDITMADVTGLPNRAIHLLADHTYNGTVRYFMDNTINLEIAAFGGYYTMAEFLTLQSIFNDYISRL